MDLASLQTKRDELEKSLTQAQANLYAVQGAIQLLDNLLAEERAKVVEEKPGEAKKKEGKI